MISAVLAAFLVFGIFKLTDRKNETDLELDQWTSFALIFVPALILFLVSFVVGIFALQEWIISLSLLFFILVPFFLLKIGYEYSTKKAFGYACICFCVYIAVDIGIAVLFGVL